MPIPDCLKTVWNVHTNILYAGAVWTLLKNSVSSVILSLTYFTKHYFWCAECLSLLSIAAIKIMTQSSLGRKRFTCFACLTIVPSLRKPRAGTQAKRDPEAGTAEEAMEECCVLRVLIASCPSTFLSLPGPPDRRWHCPRWASHPTSIHSQERAILTAWSLIWRKHFLSWKSLGHSDSTLCPTGEGKWHTDDAVRLSTPCFPPFRPLLLTPHPCFPLLLLLSPLSSPYLRQNLPVTQTGIGFMTLQGL